MQSVKFVPEREGVCRRLQQLKLQRVSGCLVNEMPADVEDTLVHVARIEGGEEGRTHVERAPGAARALIHDSGDLPDVLLRVVDSHLFAAVGVLRVLGLVKGHNEVRVGAGPATGTETDTEVGGVTAEKGRMSEVSFCMGRGAFDRTGRWKGHGAEGCEREDILKVTLLDRGGRGSQGQHSRGGKGNLGEREHVEGSERKDEDKQREPDLTVEREW